LITPEEIKVDLVSKLVAGLAAVKMQLGAPGVINHIERCGGESAPATMVAEKKPPRMRRACSNRDRLNEGGAGDTFVYSMAHHIIEDVNNSNQVQPLP
jgi:hypothetical protein